MTFNMGDIVQCENNTAQKAYICRDKILGVTNSYVICFFDGPMKNMTDKQQAFFGNQCGCYIIDNTQLTGTVSVNASITVVGTGTTFTTDYMVGDKIIIGKYQRVVSSIADNTHLDVSVAYTIPESGREHRNIGQLY
jgi:hypothetical protein